MAGGLLLGLVGEPPGPQGFKINLCTFIHYIIISQGWHTLYKLSSRRMCAENILTACAKPLDERLSTLVVWM
jgi:hypothetical protein